MEFTVPPSLLRQIWTSIEALAPATLETLEDRELAQFLTREVDQRNGLTASESSCVSQYICNKALLIRDIAQSREVAH